MGHSSKEMVYQTYGEYVEDLEDDMDDTFRYFGQDFLIKPAKRRTPNLSYGDSFGASLLSAHITY